MHRGFTLSELLIALAILGVIAMFSIPKILTSHMHVEHNAALKEAVSAVSQACLEHKRLNRQNANTDAQDYIQYLNYVRYDTVSLIDDSTLGGSRSCAEPCTFLHNGSALRFNGEAYLGTQTTNAVLIEFDPDGIYSGITTGPGKSAQLFLYYNCRLST